MKVSFAKQFALSVIAAGTLATTGAAAQTGCYYGSNGAGYYSPYTYGSSYSYPATIERPMIYSNAYPTYDPGYGYVHVYRPFNPGRAAEHVINFGLGALFHVL